MKKILHRIRIRKTFPSPRQRRAIDLGPVEIMALLEWRLRDRPTALRNARRLYEKFCLILYRLLERASPNSSRRAK